MSVSAPTAHTFKKLMERVTVPQCSLLVCLLLLCVASILLRFSHLGVKNFGLDEILHVYAANELMRGNPPLLPSGFVYERAVSYSFLVGLTGFLGGFSESILRIPSAICGVISVGMVYWLTARWYSAVAGVAAAFLMTFSPIEVAFSREVRMYTLFQLLFLFILFFFFEGFESSSRKHSHEEKLSLMKKWFLRLEIRPLFLVLAAFTFLLAWEVHKLAQPGVSGLLVYMLVMGGTAIFMKNLDGAIRAKYIGAGSLLVIGAVLAGVIFPEHLETLVKTATAVPPWYQERSGNWNYYRWQILDEFPILFGCLSMSLFWCCVRNAKVSVFLALSFLVPFLLHSFMFSRKSYHYIIHLLPIMYILAGVGVGEMLSFLWSRGKQLNAKAFFRRKLWEGCVVTVLGVAVFGTMINMPWFKRTLKDFSTDFRSPHFVDVQHHSWSRVMQYISQHSTEKDIIISSYPLLLHYYGATQPLYFMNEAYVDQNVRTNFRNDQGELLDYTLGTVVLETLTDLKTILENHPSGWLVTYRWREEGYWNHGRRPLPLVGSFPNDVLSYLKRHYRLEAIPHADDMAVWRWTHHHDSRS